LAAATSRSQIVSSGVDVSARIAVSVSCATTPDRPSEHNSSRSPAWGSSSTVSMSGSLPPDSARVTTFRQGCWRAAEDVIVPARTCSSTQE
jgi:hypothetical protein